MIPVGKLAKLSPRHRMRKMALVLGEVERDLLGRREAEPDTSFARYGIDLTRLLLSDKDASAAVRSAATSLSGACERLAGSGEPSRAPLAREELVRAVDSLRYALIAATGQAPADWDFIDPSTGLPDPGSRKVFPGRKVYLEDLRSPFNVGSVFRTADAFGVEEIILSPSCADPRHPRAKRSAMGAIELVPWRRAELESLVADIPVFALELGGERMDGFSFPGRGIAVLGSEELGISRRAKDLCAFGTVSIPMGGAKGSLNVGVAFGILMYAWTYNWFD
jgi:TrmH family RNA methyltransferase